MGKMDPCPHCGTAVIPTLAPLFGWRCPKCRALWLPKPKETLNSEELRALLALAEEEIDHEVDRANKAQLLLETMRILREGDFQLVRNFAEALGIPFVEQPKLPGNEWEQFHSGVWAMKERLEKAEEALRAANNLCSAAENAHFQCPPHPRLSELDEEITAYIQARSTYDGDEKP